MVYDCIVLLLLCSDSTAVLSEVRDELEHDRFESRVSRRNSFAPLTNRSVTASPFPSSTIYPSPTLSAQSAPLTMQISNYPMATHSIINSTQATQIPKLRLNDEKIDTSHLPITSNHDTIRTVIKTVDPEFQLQDIKYRLGTDDRTIALQRQIKLLQAELQDQQETNDIMKTEQKKLEWENKELHEMVENHQAMILAVISREFEALFVKM